MRRLIGWVVSAIALFAAVTYVALEGGGVGVLTTRDGSASRQTHVWYAEGDGGSLWLEAATPDRPWLLDLRREPRVELEAEGETSVWRAVAVDDPAATASLREKLREKYGWRDRWVALLQDTTNAVAVRLDPAQ
jgi:hypothetical protein